jgi:putative tributyrin esterase
MEPHLWNMELHGNGESDGLLSCPSSRPRNDNQVMAHLTCKFRSESLGVNTGINVILPRATGDSQNTPKGVSAHRRYPVLYLLHGWSDDDSIWMRRTSIERYAEALGLVIIMPRVELSFYQNMSTGMPFWDFIADELPAVCREWFPISDRREDTFAAGLSMGGYGAFRLGLSRPEQFSAVASLSGALDIANIRTQWEEDPERHRKLEAIWGKDLCDFTPASDLLHLASELSQSGKPQPRLFQWCGTEDFLYEQNISFRDHARSAGLTLEYREGPGDHSWEHWDREIQTVLQWLGISSMNT